MAATRNSWGLVIGVALLLLAVLVFYGSSLLGGLLPDPVAPADPGPRPIPRADAGLEAEAKAHALDLAQPVQIRTSAPRP